MSFCLVLDDSLGEPLMVVRVMWQVREIEERKERKERMEAIQRESPREVRMAGRFEMDFLLQVG